MMGMRDTSPVRRARRLNAGLLVDSSDLPLDDVAKELDIHKIDLLMKPESPSRVIN